jgi:UDP-glucose 4-epimerase
VAAKDSRRSLAFVGNVASAIIAVARLRTPFAETFFVDDGAAVATSDFVRGIARALGRPARLLRIPAGVLRAIGQAGDFMHRVGAVSPITTRTIEPFVRSLVLDSSKLRRLAPPDHWCSTEDGLQLTAAWYKSR